MAKRTDAAVAKLKLGLAAPLDELLDCYGKDGPESAAGTLRLFATMVRQGQLSEAQRCFVADLIEELASKGVVKLPPKRKPRRDETQSRKLWIEFERGIELGDPKAQIYARMAKTYGISERAVSNAIARGRKGVCEALKANLEAGADRDTLIAQTAKLFKLQPDAVARLIGD